MKRILVVIALMMLVGSQCFARKNVDIYVPSMSGKIEMLEELGMVDHVDPIQYDREHGLNPKKPSVVAKARPRKTTHQRQVVGLNADQ